MDDNRINHTHKSNNSREIRGLYHKGQVQGTCSSYGRASCSMIKGLVVQILLHFVVVPFSKTLNCSKWAGRALHGSSHALVWVNERIKGYCKIALGYHEGAGKLYKCSSFTKEDSGNCPAQGQLGFVASLSSLWILFLVFGLQGETLRPTIDQSTNVTGSLWTSTAASLSLKLVKLPTLSFRQKSPTTKCQMDNKQRSEVKLANQTLGEGKA